MGYKERNNMTIKQKIKKARYVFGWVRLSEHDGAYLQIQKQSVLELLKDNEVDESEFVLRDCGDLYIN